MATSSLRISSTLSLPPEAALWTFGDLGIKGSGKTFSACVLAEEMVKAGIPIVALDSLGIWWGLRAGVDEKGNPDGKGLPIVIFGGQHKDIPIPIKIEKGRSLVDEDKLKLVVKAILEARMSAVLDTSEFSKSMQRRIVTIFVNELYHLNALYGTRHVFIEEADLWAPQRLSGDVAASAGAIDDLVRRGGNFNLGCTLITQRSAVLNKDVLTQVNCLIIMRILHKLDKEAVHTWVASMARPNDKSIAKWYDTLRDLKNGEAWIWHPQEPEIFKRIQFRKRETLHATREYFQQAKWQQESVKLMDVDEFISKFKKFFEPKKAVTQSREDHTIIRTDAPPQVPLVREIPSVVYRDKNNDGAPEVVKQSLPNIVVQQFKPTISIPVEITGQPTTALGRVVVVLKNDASAGGRQDKWTINRISEHVKRHAWEDDGVEEAVGQLTRWEVLVKQSNNYIRFYPQRVQIVQAEAELRVS